MKESAENKIMEPLGKSRASKHDCRGGGRYLQAYLLDYLSLYLISMIYLFVSMMYFPILSLGLGLGLGLVSYRVPSEFRTGRDGLVQFICIVSCLVVR